MINSLLQLPTSVSTLMNHPNVLLPSTKLRVNFGGTMYSLSLTVYYLVHTYNILLLTFYAIHRMKYAQRYVIVLQ